MFYNCFNIPNAKLQIGDIVFYRTIVNFSTNFISSVIASSQAKKAFYHVALISGISENNIELIDSTPEKGVSTSNYVNLCKTHGLFQDVEVMRVNLSQEEIFLAVQEAKSLVGSEYNDLFSNTHINSKGNIAFYCSELVQYSFNNAAGKNIFQDIPMSFKDSTEEISQYWKDYYSERSAIVPQDAPGTHPSSIFESEYLTCV